MPSAPLQYHVKRSRGKLVVQAKGRTMKGQQFIVKEVTLPDASMADKNFKSDLGKAIAEITPAPGDSPA